MHKLSVNAVLNEGTYVLAQAGLDTPRVDARILLLHAINADNLALAPQRLEKEQIERYFTAIGARANRQPLQHITGQMHFRYLTLKSRPGVFIVRPETEEVTQAAIEAVKQMRQTTVQVIDLCTGSGAIALAMYKELSKLIPQLRVFAVEKYRKALELARENAKDLSIDIEIIEGDARYPRSWGSYCSQLLGNTDLVVSNPPYVDKSPEQPEALADPHQALYGGGEKGLDLPKQIIEAAVQLLKPGGILVMEHGSEQSKALRTYATDMGFVETETGQDLVGKDRYLWARFGAQKHEN